jgi:hypothetical protein
MVGVAVVAQRRAKAGPVLPPPTKALATGVKVRVFAAYSRRVPSARAKAIRVPIVTRWWGDNHRPVPLIIGSAKILLIVRSAMMGRAGLRPAHARVLSEHRRGNGGGKNYHCT